MALDSRAHAQGLGRQFSLHPHKFLALRASWSGSELPVPEALSVAGLTSEPLWVRYLQGPAKAGQGSLATVHLGGLPRDRSDLQSPRDLEGLPSGRRVVRMEAVSQALGPRSRSPAGLPDPCGGARPFDWHSGLARIRQMRPSPPALDARGVAVAGAKRTVTAPWQGVGSWWEQNRGSCMGGGGAGLCNRHPAGLGPGAARRSLEPGLTRAWGCLL